MSQCRLCLSEDSRFTDVGEIRDGLPISVIVMIVCPIKLEPNDFLPRHLCEECLEVVLSAYYLRNECLKTDRYLRESTVVDPIAKEEREDSKPNVIVEYQDDTESSLDPLTSPLSIRESNKFYVNTYNNLKKASRSTAWKYMGDLCDKSGNIVNGDFVYCKLCVAKNIMSKYRKPSSTGILKLHLRKVHNIVDQDSEDLSDVPRQEVFKSKDSHESNPKGSISNLRNPVSLTNSVFKQEDVSSSEKYDDYDDYDDFNEERLFKDENSKQPKLSYNNDFEDQPLPKTSGSRKKVYVNCYKSKSKSKVWQYMGSLCNESGEVIDPKFLYCRLCVNKNVMTKYKSSNGTSIIIRHLVREHKLAEEFSTTSESTPVRLTCDHCYATFKSKDLLQNHLLKVLRKKLPRTSKNYLKTHIVGDCCKNIIYNKSGHGVHCFKSTAKKSIVWKYFGILVGMDGNPVSAEADQVFCKICAENDSYKSYSTKDSSTSQCHHHLKIFHDFIFTDQNVGEGSELAHKSIYSINNKRKHCEECNLTFGTGIAYANHTRKLHPTKHVNFMCHICSKSFLQNQSLLRHLELHEGTEYKCHVCLSIFKSLRNVKRHMDHQHPTHRTRFHCDHCSKTFGTKTSLRRHILPVHLYQQSQPTNAGIAQKSSIKPLLTRT